MLSKPLLVMVSPDTNAEELQALCEAGASGVVTTDNFSKLRRLIDKLAPPKAGKRRKVEPLLPRLSSQRETVAEEEDDEEEEDD